MRRSRGLGDVLRERPLVGQAGDHLAGSHRGVVRRHRHPERAQAGAGAEAGVDHDPPGHRARRCLDGRELRPRPGRASRGQPGLLVPGSRRAEDTPVADRGERAAPGGERRARGSRPEPRRRWLGAGRRCHRSRRPRSARSRGPSARGRPCGARSRSAARARCDARRHETSCGRPRDGRRSPRRDAPR